MQLQWVNGACHVAMSGCPNRRSPDVDEVFQICCGALRNLHLVSYGLLYVWDE